MTQNLNNRISLIMAGGGIGLSLMSAALHVYTKDELKDAVVMASVGDVAMNESIVSASAWGREFRNKCSLQDIEVQKQKAVSGISYVTGVDTQGLVLAKLDTSTVPLKVINDRASVNECFADKAKGNLMWNKSLNEGLPVSGALGGLFLLACAGRIGWGSSRKAKEGALAQQAPEPQGLS